MIHHALVVGADKATGRPGDALEYSAGSAAASLIVGTKNVLLEFQGGASYSSDTPDFWRRENSPYPSHAGRFTAEPGYFKHIEGATHLLMDRYKAKPSDFEHAIFHTPNGRFPAKAAQMLGFTKEQTQYARVVVELGNSYTASAFIALCSVLEYAKPGEKILFVSYGSGAGSDAFIFTATKELEKRRKKLSEMMKDKHYLDYMSYMKHMNVEH
jgi:hydroxymethylglutaryl-CoA synthase